MAAIRKKPALTAAAVLLAALAAPVALGTGQASAASVATWDKVAQCESTGNWSAINPVGPYYGGLQFSQSTWLYFGGARYAPYAHQATKQQQILIAEKVLAVQGPGAWPHCSPGTGLATDHADPYPAGTGYPDPATLPAGTLVKSPNGPTVKVLVSGAGLPVTGSDVATDGYDLNKVVLVDDARFNALPTNPPEGTVVHDQGSGNSRYVVVAGAALPISGADWTAAGYDKRPDMGVPSSFLASAVAATLPTGLVIHDQAGGTARYVVVRGAALPISGGEWTADGYNTRADMGVPGAFLASAVATTVPTGTVLAGQSLGDPSRYVMINGSALPISADEWTANGYSTQPLLGVPETWLAGAAAKPLPNGTVVKNVNNADPSVYVMAGGQAVPLTPADYTAFGYDQRPLMGVPGAWMAGAAARTAPADGTLLVSPDSTTVWQVVAGGGKKALTEADFGPGKLSFSDVVRVPTALTAKLPTVTS
ncbi:transglycosylase family protein [Kitasatospora sp. NPDC057965]|uniref:transglycosylase family protein n=1 Tax=Kitasatospora sp. NPDC057965 TaxID=3346291 RepID=UPI0036DD32A9